MTAGPLSPSGHVDTFTRDGLPPRDQWPLLEFTQPELQYPHRLNAASALIDGGVERFGADRIAMRTPSGERWTYGDLQRRANQVAQVLTEDLHLVPGNRVFIRAPNMPWTVAMWLGAIKAGGVAVTTMVAWRSAEIAKVAAKTKPSVVLVDHRYADELNGAIDSPIPVLRAGGEHDQLIAACSAKSGQFTAAATAADDVAILGATSGTTGEPKVTMHFHRDVLAIADTFARCVLRIRADDVCAGTAPLAFTFGLGGLLVFPLRFGASSFLTEKASPTELASCIESCGITVLYTAPTGYRHIVKDGKAGALAKLRVGVSAGEHLPRDTFDQVARVSGLRLVNGLGTTELLHVFISASGDDIRPGATGRVVPGYRAAILDEDGRELGPGEAGRLGIIGPTGCRYLNDARQRHAVCGGWNITGDTYVRDEDGYFIYQSRSDGMIITAGYNVSATEVEGVIDTHPDVLESAVVGRPDPDTGTIVNAFVVLRPGVTADDAARESIRAHVKTHLATYKTPRRIDWVDRLPRNPSGKLQHFILRQRAAAEASADLERAKLERER